MTDTSFSFKSLLDHTDWMAALARQLVNDPSRADDVVQQTMLEAMRRPPSNWSNPRAWLATVARNVARNFARADARRARREAAAAKYDVAGSTAELVERASLHRQLVDGVLSLKEPYQSVLLMRFFDDLPPREIAKRFERPVETVRTQIARGIELMRKQLDEEHGDRRSWCVALLPLLHPSKAVATGSLLTLGGALMTLKWTVPIAAAVVLWATLTPKDPVSLPMVSAELEDPVTKPVKLAEHEPERAKVAADPVAPIAELHKVIPLDEFSARLVDLQGNPMRGVAVSHKHQAPWIDDNQVLHLGEQRADLKNAHTKDMLTRESGIKALLGKTANPSEVRTVIDGQPLNRDPATTDVEGRFSLAGVLNDQGIALDGGLITYGSGELPDDEELIIIAGPSVRLAGVVIGQDRAVVEDASLAIMYQINSLPGIAQTLESAGTRQILTTTDHLGHFDLGRVPRLSILKLEVRKLGFERWESQYPKFDSPAMQIELRPKTSDKRIYVSGTVVLQDGTTTDGVRVKFGQDEDLTDAHGHFKFEVTYMDDKESLLAYTQDHLPVVLRGFGRKLREDRTAGVDLRLVLGGKPLSIEGQALDTNGNPIPGLRVWLDNPVLIGNSTTTLEEKLGGYSRRLDSLSPMTDEDGRFEINGLLDRSYRIGVRDKKSFLVLISELVPAGTRNLVLQEQAGSFTPKLSGVVVDLSGQPIAGAPVSLAVMLTHGNGVKSWTSRDDKTVTDAKGRFEFIDCPLRNVFLNVGDDIYSESKHVKLQSNGRDDLRIVATRLFRFRARPGATIGADRFQVMNARGEAMAVTLETPDSTLRTYWADLAPAALAPKCTVEEGASYILLYRGKKQIGRVDLVLRHGEVVDLMF